MKKLLMAMTVLITSCNTAVDMEQQVDVPLWGQLQIPAGGHRQGAREAGGPGKGRQGCATRQDACSWRTTACCR